MNVITRGTRNAFRNKVRTFSIVIILGLSIGLALSMLVARQAVNDKIASVKSSIGNSITITPAGAQGFQGGGEPLTTDQLSTIRKIPNVSSVRETLSDRLTTENTTLVSAIEPGSLGNRAGGNSGVGFVAPPPTSERGQASGGGSEQQVTRTFSPPVIATGANDLTSPSVYGGDKVTFTSGQAIDPTKDVDEAVIGKALAEKNNLNVGSSFTAYGKTITVAGIYDTGSEFSNAGLLFSLQTLQRLSSQTGSVTSATVTVNSIDNVDSVTSAVKQSLGDKADVVNSQDTAKQAIEPLESVRTISSFSLIGALGAGSIIILLTMVMIVRERRREIGVMKAIGASNTKIMLQFMSEAVTLTLISMIVGIGVGIVAANPITKVLVNNSSSATSSTSSNAGGPQTQMRGSGGPGPAQARRFSNNTVENVKNIKASVGIEILAYGFSAAMIIALVGSALPALLISKIRPAEVMRAE